MFTYRTDHTRKMFSPPITQIITINRCNDHMQQTKFFHSNGNILRLICIQHIRNAGAHITKRTRTGANLAHDHHGCVFFLPTLTNVRATSLLTHSDEIVFFNYFTCLIIGLRTGCFYTNPRRFCHTRCCRTIGLFWMPHSILRSRLGVEYCYHNNAPSCGL